MARGKIEKIDKASKKVTIKGKEYQIGKKIWNENKLDENLESGMEIEYDLKGANLDFKRIISQIEKNSERNSAPKKGGGAVSKKVEKFAYPYNFVRINDKVERENFEPGKLSGKLLCTLTNKSPLFIQGERKEDAKNHPSEWFLKEDGNYIIPGSSLKGGFRSVLEAISNSCMVNIEDEKLEHRLEAKVDPTRVFGKIIKFPTKTEDGIIAKAEVVRIPHSIIPQKYKKSEKLIEGMHEISLGQEIKNPNNYDYDKFGRKKIKSLQAFESIINGKKLYNGTLWISSNIFNKKNEKILYVTENAKEYPFSYEEYEDIKYLIKQRREREEKNGKKFYIEELKDGAVEGDVIIFQAENGKAKNLAFSEIPRLRYKLSPYDLIPKNLRACETYDDTCLACRIFGMTGNEKEDTLEENKEIHTLRGRVFFKDATINKKDASIQLNPVLIKSLGEPHPSLSRFYLDGTYDEATARIRGRKFYWHHNDKIEKDYSSFKKSITPHNPEKHNSSIQFMNHGNKFTFEVEFNKLTEKELGLLLLTLELEEGMLHKFGKAKALGFGSSEVKVEKLLFKNPNRYETFDNSYIESNEKENLISKFKSEFNLESQNQWKDLKVIMNKTNELVFSDSPFPEETGKKGDKNTLEWFKVNKTTQLPKIQDY